MCNSTYQQQTSDFERLLSSDSQSVHTPHKTSNYSCNVSTLHMQQISHSHEFMATSPRPQTLPAHVRKYRGTPRTELLISSATQLTSTTSKDSGLVFDTVRRSCLRHSATAMLLSRSFNACKVLIADPEARIHAVKLISYSYGSFMFAVPQGQRQQQCKQQAHRYERVLWPSALLICSPVHGYMHSVCSCISCR
jgi:hypothetical protein